MHPTQPAQPTRDIVDVINEESAEWLAVDLTEVAGLVARESGGRKGGNETAGRASVFGAGVEKAIETNAKSKGAAAIAGINLDKIKGSMGPIASLILESDIRSIQVEEDPKGFVRPHMDHVTRQQLAFSIGVGTDDLEEVVEGVNKTFGAETWESMILMARTTNLMASAMLRKQGWDNLESKALRKLEILVDQDKIRQPAELLAVAAAANRANRNTNATPAAVPSGGTQINIFGEQAVKAHLGSGDLGTIQLELSPRLSRQLANPKPDSGTVLRNSKMIDAVALREISDESLKPKDEESNSE